MSALGQKRTCRQGSGMSASPPITDIDHRCVDVRFVPCVDILARALLRLVHRSRAPTGRPIPKCNTASVSVVFPCKKRG